MFIVLGVFFATYLVAAYCMKWTGAPKDRLSFKDALSVSLVPAFFVALIVGGGAWTAAYQWQQDPVDIKYNIYPGPEGRYVDDNGSTTTWYYKDGVALKEAWKDSDYVNVNYVPGDESHGYVEAECSSSETVPRWLLLPWERGKDYVFKRECSYEDFDLFIPMGEN